ncbi:glutamate 5-kinase [Falsibacillus albus]|uniref:Glutamate 5-kinase n=1 Tax=Falsibacillus albus TaxID=2478915 RepID=A0A3L7K166_9BACI|nr:glutamate 5-kinase [Falsibacillus albus]RLQ96335.1 glutamate 5-kinase [Falsibacillus albus]
MGKMRIVVKIGSSSLTNDQGEIDQEKLTDHVLALASLKGEGHDVLLVSSGAVAAGFKRLGYPSRPVTLKGKQAAAAVGQGLLMQCYHEKFNEHHITPAQILLTRSDFSNRNRYKNAYATMNELLDRNMLPVINENDSVAVEELTFGDNDLLSALVSGLIHADMLIILTDINGLYDADPRSDPKASRINELVAISEEMMKAAEGAGTKVGTGGMKSKLNAANMALSLGIPVFIGKGEGSSKLTEILVGSGDGTYIGRKGLSTISTHRQWIAFHSEVSGEIHIDQGAKQALLYNGKSLLSAGVSSVEGIFQPGDVVEVFCDDGLLGKGEVSCSSMELSKAMNSLQQHKNSTLVIHRNKWIKF